MSLRGRVWRLLGKVERRLTLAEDSVERTEGAVNNMLAIGTELKETAATLRATADRLEAAVVEQGRSLRDAYEAMRDERERRAGLGQEVMRQSGRLDTAERRLGALEEIRPNGAAE